MSVKTDPSAGPEYRLVRSARRTLAVQVNAAGEVVVRAPRRASQRAIEDFVAVQQPWIDRQVQRARKRIAERPLHSFEEGSTVPLLGRDVVLRFGTSEAPDDELAIPGCRPDADRESRRAAVVARILELAPSLIADVHTDAAARVGVGAKRILVKELRSRWGSCGPDRRMNLCWRLVLAPREVLDYVVVHELCHIHEPNHSRRFWSRVEAACPEYRTHRRWLREHGHRLVL